jgi:hypothetical protein
VRSLQIFFFDRDRHSNNDKNIPPTTVYYFHVRYVTKPAQTLVVYHNERRVSLHVLDIFHFLFFRKIKIMGLLCFLHVLCACVYASLFQLWNQWSDMRFGMNLVAFEAIQKL